MEKLTYFATLKDTIDIPYGIPMSVITSYVTECKNDSITSFIISAFLILICIICELLFLSKNGKTNTEYALMFRMVSIMTLVISMGMLILSAYKTSTYITANTDPIGTYILKHPTDVKELSKINQKTIDLHD